MGKRQPVVTPYSEAGISALAFSPDGTLLAGAGMHSVVLWKVDTGEVARLLPAASGNAAYLRFSPDGKTLTTISAFPGVGADQRQNVLMYPSVREWNVQTGEERRASRS